MDSRKMEKACRAGQDLTNFDSSISGKQYQIMVNGHLKLKVLCELVGYVTLTRAQLRFLEFHALVMGVSPPPPPPPWHDS